MATGAPAEATVAPAEATGASAEEDAREAPAAEVAVEPTPAAAPDASATATPAAVESAAECRPATEGESTAAETASATVAADPGQKEEASTDPLVEAERLKALGNTAFQAKNHSEAARLYGEAIAAAGEQALPVYFSNRAVCRATLGDYAGACEDAREALQRPGGITKKALFQKVRAELRLQRPADALETLSLAATNGLRAEVEQLLKADGLALPETSKQSSGSTPLQKPANGVGGDPAATAKELGNARYKEGNYREALAEYQKALELLPKDDNERRSQFLGNAAAACLMLRRVADCCSMCQKALDIDPRNSKIRARLATAQVAKGDFDLARNTLGEVNGDTTLSNVRKQIADWENMLFTADKTLKGGEPAKALSILADLETKALFDCPAVNLRMGRCYLELKNYPRVLNTTQQVLRANPQNIDALVLRTEALYRNNTATVDERQWTDPLEQGQKLLREALSFDPDHKAAQQLRKKLRSLCSKCNELRSLMDSREFEKARELLDSMIEECSDNPVMLARLYCERAKAGVRLKDWPRVLKDVGQATYKDHELVQPYLFRAQALQNLDRHEDAVKDLEGLFSWYREQGVYEKLQEAKFLLRKKKRTDYYQLLQVPSVASQLEIKKAYKERAAEWHPDKKGHLDEVSRKNAEEMFKRIGEAYEVLTDSTKKELYDKGYDLEGIEEQIELKKRRAEHGHGHGHGHH